MKRRNRLAKLSVAVLSTLSLLLVTLASITTTMTTANAYSSGRVTEVFLKADDGRPTGACPVRVVWRGYIRADGPCRVQYTFTRSDGAVAPVQEIEFTSAGTREVSTTWTLGGDSLPSYRGWQALKVVYPNVIESSRETGGFEMRCGSGGARERFQVTAAELKADSHRNVGACPVQVNFAGSITTNGAGRVRYVFTRSDGATSREYTMDFAAAGTQPINTSWTLGGDSLPSYRGWQAVRIVSPNTFESSHETGAFVMRCR